MLGMRRRAVILLAVAFAMLARPLHLPAASCILSTSPSEKACKMDCCANKSCCANSKGSKTPVSQPLHPTEIAKQQPVIGFVSVPLVDLLETDGFPRSARDEIPSRAHAPPPLATSCIRLI
jgi:hypothetical protein